MLKMLVWKSGKGSQYSEESGVINVWKDWNFSEKIMQIWCCENWGPQSSDCEECCLLRYYAM
jgi:hypothetical protein